MESNLLGNVSNLFSLAISKIKGYFVLLRTKMELFKNTLVQILVSYHSNNPHNKLKINKKETKNLFFVFNIVCLPPVFYINYMIFYLDCSPLQSLASILFFSSTHMFWLFSICLNYYTNKKPL